MFEGFRTELVDVGEATLHVRSGGDGPPVLLLHGHPRTSATWHRVAPRLVAQGFRVVCPDLRGYGQSVGPPPAADHSAHSKRAVAGDLVRLMDHLGHARFALAGHDRGSYVALRLALDHPDPGVPAGPAGLHPDQRAPGPDGCAVRHGLVALVLLRPARHPGAGDQRRPGRLVPRRPRGDGAGEPRRVPPGHPEPGGRPGDAGGLPRRPHRRPRPRGGRPRRRAEDQLSAAAALVARGRSRGPLRRPAADLGRLGGRRTRARDRLDPPHGRGGAGSPGRRAGRVLRR